MFVSSSASYSWFKNNKQIDVHQEIRIFNVDFRHFAITLAVDLNYMAVYCRILNEETRARLVNTLMACAGPIQKNSLSLADALAFCPGGLPPFQLTGIGGNSQPDDSTDDLQEVGAFEEVLDLIKQIQPKIVTITEQEANHSGSCYMNRVKEAWLYYSTMFDVLENSDQQFRPGDGGAVPWAGDQ
ncbi:hypothetical protein H5410_053146 [Solanum commersonii]|uniref:Uncharacterized protein n=1 Tax=Solanum commersonii TaxID=4109 RepID=A0A9J5X444_SOLCO|nr:hypothetical protein H5410_053146 [Solanum commersonii]